MRYLTLRVNKEVDTQMTEEEKPWDMRGEPPQDRELEHLLRRAGFFMPDPMYIPHGFDENFKHAAEIRLTAELERKAALDAQWTLRSVGGPHHARVVFTPCSMPESGPDGDGGQIAANDDDDEFWGDIFQPVEVMKARQRSMCPSLCRC